ncbi:MAG: DUF4810 domain-containing protein [Proteobacteria bacterium]|nr:DUF4810 domain-containing protein [Pseudomonadota bacterium]
MKKLDTACLVLVAALSGGCATTQYNWNNYDQRLLDFYKSAGKDGDFLSVMDVHVIELEAKGVRPPPGLYAEVGTFHLRRGDRARAVAFYAKEQAAWPESRSLMTALIRSLDEKNKGDEK